MVPLKSLVSDGSHIPSLFVCVFGQTFRSFFRVRNVIEARSMPPRVMISRFVPAGLRSVCCHKPGAVLAPDFSSFASAAVFSGEINRYMSLRLFSLLSFES